MKQCPVCEGRSWVPDGDIDDGMMTGRTHCPLCEDGTITADDLEAYVERIRERAPDVQ